MRQNRLKAFLLVLLNLFFLTGFAQYNLDWATNIQSVSGANYGTFVTTDNQGNIYELARFSGTADFDPGPGVFSMTSNGQTDIYLRKLSSTGDYIWAIQIGGADYDVPTELVVDNSGNVIVVGYFEETVDFDPGPGVVNLTPNNVGYTEGFIQKLDANGNLLWVTQLGSTSDDYIHSVTADSLGNIYTTGSFRNTVDFDPGPGVFNLTANSASVFVQKLDPNGNFEWATMIDGPSACSGQAITVNNGGNVYVSGGFQGVVDFDPGPGVFNLTSLGSFDIFVQKLDTAGNWQWARGMGNTGYDFGKSITTDLNGDVLICGNFEDTVDFDPSPGVLNIGSSGGKDGFTQKLDASGNLIWAQNLGGVNSDRIESVKTDANNNIIITGQFQGTVDFDPGPGVMNLTSTGNFGIFVRSQSPSGDLIWAEKYGGSSSAYGYTLALDGNDNVIVTGTYSGTTDFDPGPGNYVLSSYSTSNALVLKLRKCQPTAGTDIQTACDTYTWIDGNTYASSNNTATSLLTNADGCDSLVTLDLTINYSDTITDVQTECDSYTWIDGITYSASNNSATWTLTNSNGCDSVVALDLTILNSTTGIDQHTACDTFTWIDGNTYTSSNSTATWTLTNSVGCDSTVTLDLLINNSTTGADVQTACNSFTWIDGNTYTASNNSATWLLSTSAGCDSLVTLDLTLNSSNAGTDVQTSCDSFTWIDGNTYISSNNSATWILTNAQGCDSLVTLDLTMNFSSTGTTDVQTACDSYTWIDGNTYTSSNNSATWILTNTQGCDSLVTLDLTINYSSTEPTDVQTACDSYTWIDGNTYSSSNNTATWTLTNASGCDSIITLDLTIIPTPSTNVTQSGVLLSSDEIGVNYQWLDCDDDFSPIAGATNQTYLPTALTGNYAVEVDLSGCVDTSSCYLVDFTSIDEVIKHKLRLNPNPASDVIFISGIDEINGLRSLQIVSLDGKLESTIHSLSAEIRIAHLTAGVYFLKIKHDQGVEILRFVKK